MNEQAGALLRQAERSDVVLTTSDAVIAEVAFVLTSRAHYQLPVADAAARLVTLLRLRGMKLREKRVLLRALELWTAQPRLGFVDALTAAYAQQPGVELTTFDTDFDEIPGMRRWQPAASGEGLA
jgi:predicted nucleic acid-binding protein